MQAWNQRQQLYSESLLQQYEPRLLLSGIQSKLILNVFQGNCCNNILSKVIVVTVWWKMRQINMARPIRFSIRTVTHKECLKMRVTYLNRHFSRVSFSCYLKVKVSKLWNESELCMRCGMNHVYAGTCVTRVHSWEWEDTYRVFHNQSAILWGWEFRR